MFLLSAYCTVASLCVSPSLTNDVLSFSMNSATLVILAFKQWDITHIWQLFSVAAICWTVFEHTHFLSFSAQTSHEYERPTIFLWCPGSNLDFIAMFSVPFTVTLEQWLQGEQHLRVTWLLLNSPALFHMLVWAGWLQHGAISFSSHTSSAPWALIQCDHHY